MKQTVETLDGEIGRARTYLDKVRQEEAAEVSRGIAEVESGELKL